jgi:SAM-dependent methyltransferase
MSNIKKSIETVKQAWISSRYYEDAEKWTYLFWREEGVFKKKFNELDLSRCAELACGHGRHAEQLLQRYSARVQTLYCLDVIEDNIIYTRNRLAMFSNVYFLLISGSDFQPIPSNSLTSIFCYDAMVHFSPDIIEAYLIDASRVLAPKGRALFHHSNLNAPETGLAGKHYGQNPHARNHMTLDLFESLAKKAGLRILETSAIQWSGISDLDRVSLLERSAI